MSTAFQHPGAAKEAQRLIEEALATGATELDFSGLRLRYLPKELAKLAGQLTSLDLTGCRALTSLDGIEQLTALTALDLSGCNALFSLEGINKLIALTSLNVSHCDALTSLDAIEQLTALTSLNVSHCDALTSLDGIKQLTALTSLNVSWCDALTSLDGINKLSALTSLDVSRCHALANLDSVEKLTALTSLDVSGCNTLTSLHSVNQLTALTSLDVSGCPALTSLHSINQLTALTSLDVSWSPALTSLDGINKLTALTSLNVSRCHALNLDGINKLTALTSLDVRGCDALTSLDSINKLTALTSLDVSGCEALTSLDGIDKLTALTSLDVSGCEALTSLDGLDKLTALASLAVGGGRSLASLDGINKLTALTSLSVFGCEALTSLDFLDKIIALTSLQVIGCKALTRLDGLDKLTALTSLDVSGSEVLTSLDGLDKLTALTSLDVSGCKALTSLDGINKLTALTSLDVSGCKALTSLDGIDKLTALTSLNLSRCRALTSLDGIDKLTALSSLNLSGCKALTSLYGIDKLSALTSLNLSRCKALTSFAGTEQLTSLTMLILGTSLFAVPFQLAEQLLLSLPYLQIFAFKGLNIEHVPPELNRHFDQTAFEDWWHAGQTHGFAPARQLKVMLLGNGRIGKTQLARRLRGEIFDEAVPSTHGIQLNTASWQQLFSGNTAVDPADADLQLHCWDFGGQDVYLGTHSLFLDDQAVYLLLWHPDSENTKLVDCESLKIRNRPLSYWLAYLKSLVGDKANIVVCQSWCDSPDMHQNAPVPNPPPFKALRTVDISSKTPDGLEQFYPVFKQALKQQLSSNNEIWLPNNWLAVEQHLRQLMIEQPALKQLPYADFVQLCSNHQVEAPATLANYLHQSGVVFYRPGHFANQLILDQQWALQGVYLLLERQQVLPELQARQGKFEQQSLQRWMQQQQLDVADLPLFLAMMQQCGACFEVRDNCYIAPDNLPEFNAAEAERIWRSSTPDVEVTLHYTFLHDATMRYLLSKIGAVAKQHAYYWRYGCCFYDVKHQCTVWFDCHMLPTAAEQLQNYSQPGEIRLRLASSNVSGHNTAELAKHLIESITEASHLGQLPTVQWLTGQPPANDSEKTASARAGSGRATSTEPFAELGAAAPPPNTPAIYFSYAWGDEYDLRQQMCDELYQQLVENYGAQHVFRDKNHMRLGESIEDFEREIGRAPLVLLVISQAYLASRHCLNELRLLYEYSQKDKQRFMQTVVPVMLPDAAIDSFEQRLDILEPWQQKRAGIEKRVNALGSMTLGAEMVAELQNYQAIESCLGNCLSWLADPLTERQTELQVEATLQLVNNKVADWLKQH